MKNTILQLMIVGLCFFSIGCKQANPDTSNNATASKPEKEVAKEAAHPEDDILPKWARNANIYEVNLRQYTSEGTIKAFEKHLPRLKEMGVDILWFMPIYPISKVNRKGTLGSYYAVADYKAVNPEFGTLEDFKSLVKKIHDAGMYVLLDWVPGHTGWDNAWIKEHSEWYKKNEKGKITHPEGTDWTDVADIDYDQKELRKALNEALVYWVKDIGVDGYRCDVAHDAPDDYWTEATTALRAVKNVFMLAESEKPSLRNKRNFVMDYGWVFKDLVNEIAEGKKNAKDIDTYLAEDAAKFTSGFHMYFTTNHDENTWSGTVFDRLGDGHKTLQVLAATIGGMPLVYSGQEAANKKRLEFFEKDQIDWGNYEYADFYKTLLHLKKRNKALWNGSYGGPLKKITTGEDNSVFAFMREMDGDKVIVITNLSKFSKDIKLNGNGIIGEYTDVFANSTLSVTADMDMKLNPWDYMILSNK